MRPNGRGESKSWVFNPHPTKEDCSSCPPWILQDAPSEVTCIEYWLRTYSKIANASDGSALHPCKAPQFGSPCLSLISAKITDFHSPLPPESYADVLSASRAILSIKSLQRPSATSQGKVNFCNFCVGCNSPKICTFPSLSYVNI